MYLTAWCLAFRGEGYCVGCGVLGYKRWSIPANSERVSAEAPTPTFLLQGYLTHEKSPYPQDHHRALDTGLR